jgi:phosphate:Na+ symporter
VHFERLRHGRVDTAETSSLHLDALRHIKQINTHLVAAAAYPVLASKGELLPNRLRQDDLTARRIKVADVGIG